MFDKVVITGFGVFGGGKMNPTYLMARELMKNKREGVEACVLDVAVGCVDEHFKQHAIKQEYTTKYLFLHLGVGPNKDYYLETAAYNNKDFRIPDNHGNVFSKEPIYHECPLDAPLACSLDLNTLCEQLKDHKVVLSSDPGRYLCNYIYYCSLKQNNPLRCSLFVHVPSPEYRTHAQNMDFIYHLLALLLKN